MVVDEQLILREMIQDDVVNPKSRSTNEHFWLRGYDVLLGNISRNVALALFENFRQFSKI